MTIPGPLADSTSIMRDRTAVAMDALQAIRQRVTLTETFRGLVLAAVLGLSVSITTPKQPNAARRFPFSSFGPEVIKTTGFFFLFLAVAWWGALVDRYVPEPYLDEVFHIPQAQAYCEGRYWDWDDKITTPPGLYLVSVAYRKLGISERCSTAGLRINNVLATLWVGVLATQCRHLIEFRAAERGLKKPTRNLSFYSLHTGLNIALFPVIFFFSALYYTDVVSTLAVLVAYRTHLHRLGPRPPSLLSDICTVLFGVFALFMRQTNVFWVVVYMGGLEAVHVLRSVKPAQGQLGTLHDPPLRQSGPKDWLLCALNIAVAVLRNPARVLRQIWPHIIILTLFAGFLAWNGGVVLGDKSNHIATIHLAQMLYIWPLLAFFSAPLLIPSFISALLRPVQYLRSLLCIRNRQAALVSIPYLTLTIVLSLAVVRYNTIIHPFTLADNRHYMFYIFRYTILRSPAIRLALVPAYTLCRWLVWDQLAGISHATGTPTPSAPTSVSKAGSEAPNTNRPYVALLDDETSSSSTSPPTSTALLWVLTTALSLVTAPLVEPRYFILPWVFYRLLLPSWSITSSLVGDDKTASAQKEGMQRPEGWLWKVGRKFDVRLVLETVWFVVVNMGTMYMFLFRPFYWRDGEGRVLDGGRVQRFMW